jgi:alanyl-tRNA synthetase
MLIMRKNISQHFLRETCICRLRAKKLFSQFNAKISVWKTEDTPMLHYLHDTNKTTLNARMVGLGEDAKGSYLLLDETIFYPQGGGQPADQGTIKAESEVLPIHFAGFVDGVVRHYTISPISEDLIGHSVFCEIDRNRRDLNARYHTAGHMLADVMSNLYQPVRPVKGHQFPGEAYVEFIDVPEGLMDNQTIQDRLNKQIMLDFPVKTYEMAKKEYEEKYGTLPYPTTDDKPFRVVGVEPFPPVPCGGTHVKSTMHVGSVKIRKVTTKQGRIKVSYEL